MCFQDPVIQVPVHPYIPRQAFLFPDIAYSGHSHKGGCQGIVNLAENGVRIGFHGGDRVEFQAGTDHHRFRAAGQALGELRVYTEIIQTGDPVHGIVQPGNSQFLADLLDFSVGLEYNFR